ncbi:deaminase [Candidatus Gracilibacteria bacterium]|nr:deaminase [Candidatus Gracilibacteria bacterium]
MLTDKNFLKIAQEISTGSKCVSKQVGAVIVKDNRILSTGYNGTPSGYINCCDYWKGEYTKDHHDWSLKYEIHAEMNAILWAARNGVEIEGSTIYCTLEPCFQCTKNILASGIKKIVYSKKYDKMGGTSDAEKFVKENGKEIIQIEDLEN